MNDFETNEAEILAGVRKTCWCQVESCGEQFQTLRSTCPSVCGMCEGIGNIR